ncbi:trehalose-phosphatase [Arthrobacter sp. I2-34]|uniref:Trehalose 6-phosphate phosphatase n=1 Tax=Arthrobacter hankyongi TaxID=2904801 RepID=A0ABS9LDZ4_9MICC|nr:trehalose-phosphatase [Arthrobacter hankyongi]MCG2624881.1 trehalose-phosphatase [Arthrobacter hankyongi]
MAEAAALPDPGLRAALEVLAGTHRLLVALDFDGVLAPIVEHAADARPLPAAAAAVTALAGLPGTTTAYISGRALASLRLVGSPDERTLLIGSHGGEVFTGPDSAPLALDAGQAAALAAATGVVERVVAGHPGTVLEAKPAGVVLHTRTAPDDVAAAATAQARALLEQIPGVHLSDGKQVLETSVISADKGQGLELLRGFTGADAVLFAGDDVTDENAFRVLRGQDVGIKVGPGETAARHRVQSPEAFAAVLALLAELRAAAVRR